MQRTSFERRQKEDDKKSEWKVEEIARVACGICGRVPWFLAVLAKIPPPPSGYRGEHHRVKILI